VVVVFDNQQSIIRSTTRSQDPEGFGGRANRSDDDVDEVMIRCCCCHHVHRLVKEGGACFILLEWTAWR